MDGGREFNEVVFQEAFIPESHLIGEVDGAWKQATSELAYERSGPERFLETLAALESLVDAVDGERGDVRGGTKCSSFAAVCSMRSGSLRS